jgi:hypothetical protein
VFGSRERLPSRRVRLTGGLAAVDDELRACGEAGLVGSEKDDDLGQPLGFPESAQRQTFLDHRPLGHRCPYDAVALDAGRRGDVHYRAATAGSQRPDRRLDAVERSRQVDRQDRVSTAPLLDSARHPSR